MKYTLLTICGVLVSWLGVGQVLNVTNTAATGRFQMCTGYTPPVVTVSYVSGSGTYFSNGGIVCTNPCGSTTVKVTISNLRWYKGPEDQWLHGLFLPANAGFTVSGINLPAGFVTYNGGCTGGCPAGIVTGPGFYYDATANNSCCGNIAAGDGIPCNNWGLTTISCSPTFGFEFNMTFCNSNLNGNSETFTLTGSDDGATGCWSNGNFLLNSSVSFTINTSACAPINNVPVSAAPVVRSCNGSNVNYTSTLTGGCGNASTITWWNAATGGTMIGSGSPFVYDPAGSACPAGTTLYASCCGSTTICVGRTPVTIPGNCDTLLITNLSSTLGDCQIPSSINSITVANASGTVNYILNPGNVTNSTGVFTGLTLGSYTVTVSDASLCTATTVVTFTPITLPNLILDSTLYPCIPEATILTSSNATVGPYQFSLNGGGYQSVDSFSNLGAGVYTISVKDGNNCLNTTTINITFPATVIIDSVQITPLTCIPGNDAAITVFAPLANGYSLNGGSFQPGNQFNNLTSGNYTITVQDSYNCTSSSVVVINPPTNPNLSVNSNNISCNGFLDGSISVTAWGGTPGYNFDLQPSNIQNTTGLFTGLGAGAYTVTVTDLPNCWNSLTVILTEPVSLTGSVVAGTILCASDTTSITVTPTGGTPPYQYNMNGGGYQSNNVFAGLMTGNYTIGIKDSHNCEYLIPVSIAEPNPLQLQINTTPILCSGDNSTLSLVASGGTPNYEYSLNGGNYQISPVFTVTAATYTITVKDNNNCTVSSVITIAEPAPLSVNVSANPILCLGDTTTITCVGNGGTLNYEFNINNGAYQSSGIFNNIVAGTYTVGIKDANSCLSNAIINIQEPTLLALSASFTPIACNGGFTTLTVNANGGTPNYQFSINGQPYQSSNIFSNILAGNYTITVLDDNGCSQSTTANITEPGPLDVQLNAGLITCAGFSTSITATASGGVLPYNFSLNGGTFQGSNIFNGVTAGSYTVVVADGNGCTISSIINISEPTPLSLNISSPGILCFGGSADITAIANGGSPTYNYSLNGSANQTNNIFSNNVIGNYTVIVEDANGCTSSSNLTLTQPSAVVITNISSTVPTCIPGNDASMTIVANGGTIPSYTYSVNGNPGQTSNVINGLGVGTYTVQVTDGNGCTVTETHIIFNSVNPVITNLNSIPVSCFGYADGGVNISVTASTLPINYELLPNGIQNGSGSFSNLSAGLYTIIATDGAGCSISTTLTINQPLVLNLSLSSSPILCNGGNAILSVLGNGGTPGYEYNLNGGSYQLSNVFSGIVAGTYTVGIKDANGCVASDIITITEPLPVNVSATMGNILCNGGNTTITAVGNGGTLAYNFSINGSAFQPSGLFNANSAGTYTITIQDANNCTATTLVTLTEPSIIVVDSISLLTPSCVPGNDGSLTIYANGGTPNYQYVVNGSLPQNANSFTNLGAGTYTIQVADANGCTMSSTTVLVTPNSPMINSVSTTNVSCNGANDGAVTVVAMGGFGLLNYTLLPNNIQNTSGQFANLSPQVYTIVVTDANNCTTSSTIQITEPGVLNFSTVEIPIPCFGGTATLNITPNGGTPNYEYNINGGNYQTSNSFSGLVVGTYTIGVKDANNCTATNIYIIAEPSQVAISVTPSPILCNGGFSTITCLGSGGTPTYEYSLNGGTFQTSNIFTNNVAGVYTITVKDINGCTFNAVTLVGEPTLLIIDSMTSTTPTCIPGNDASITVYASGGTPGYLYSLNGGPNQSSNVLNGLNAATYTITVTDTNGCTTSSLHTVVNPNSPVINNLTVTNITCFGYSNGSIEVLGSGGQGVLNYTLQPGNVTNTNGIFSGLNIGNYTIIITDALGCSISSVTNISQPNLLTITGTNITNTSCYNTSDGAADIFVSGGSGQNNFNLQPGGINNNTGNFTNLGGGTYTVTVTDVNGCTSVTTILITNPPAITLVSISGINLSCNNSNDGSITIQCTGGSGALNYNLQPGNVNNLTGIFNALAGNTYSIVVTDGNNCTYNTTITIINPLPVSFVSVVPTNILCSGDTNGTITAFATGGNPSYQYTLLPNNLTNNTGFFNNLSIGSYTIVASDVNSCTATSLVNIITPSPILFNVDSIKNVSCFSGSDGGIFTSTSGGVSPYSYVLYPGAILDSTGDFNNLNFGSYTVVVTDVNGCSLTLGPVAIIQPPAINLGLSSSQNISCFGIQDGIITVNTSGGTGPISLSISPNLGTFTPPGLFTGLSANTYTITATDNNGCTKTLTVSLSEPPPILINSITLTSPTCYGDFDGIIEVVASGGTGNLLYQIDNGSSLSTGYFLNLMAGNHLITITDQSGCKKDSIVTLTQPNPIGIQSIKIEGADCKGENTYYGKLQVKGNGGNGGYTYYLRPYIQFNQTGKFNFYAAGFYTLTIKDSRGCEYDTLIEIKPASDYMTIQMEKQDLGCFGYGNEGWARANTFNGKPPYTYTWSTSPVQNAETATNLTYGYYFVEVVDANGCKEKDTVYINPGTCCEEVFIPNAFSPNGDGLNDVFKVTTSAGIELIEFAVYDRWGNKVWNTYDYRRHWDGSYRGKEENMNTFYYLFHYKCVTDGNTYMKKGDVMVIR